MQKAIHYYEKASAKHRGEAMCAIGMIYQNGDGVDRSHVTAADWHKKCASAEQQKRDKALSRDRNAPSQWALTSMFNLGLIYHEGKWNMAQDDAEAVRWWLKVRALQHAHGFHWWMQKLLSVYLLLLLLLLLKICCG